MLPPPSAAVVVGASPPPLTLPPMASPPPPPGGCFAEVSPASEGWCGAGHPGQASYDMSTGSSYASTFGGNAQWQQAGPGWRFVGVSLEQCQLACIGIGCAEMSVTNNLASGASPVGACWLAQETCAGSLRTPDTKYSYIC